MYTFCRYKLVTMYVFYDQLHPKCYNFLNYGPLTRCTTKIILPYYNETLINHYLGTNSFFLQVRKQ